MYKYIVKPSITGPYEPDSPWGGDHCDCDERCPKCGKKKKHGIGPIWCKDDGNITFTMSH